MYPIAVLLEYKKVWNIDRHVYVLISYLVSFEKKLHSLHQSLEHGSNEKKYLTCLFKIFFYFLQIQSVFKISKNASNKEKFSKNIVSGGCAGSLSLLFVQSIDYTRTRLATGMYESCLFLLDQIFSNVFNFTQLYSIILNFTQIYSYRCKKFNRQKTV